MPRLSTRLVRIVTSEHPDGKNKTPPARAGYVTLSLDGIKAPYYNRALRTLTVDFQGAFNET
jgi:hypothetical protein